MDADAPAWQGLAARLPADCGRFRRVDIYRLQTGEQVESKTFMAAAVSAGVIAFVLLMASGAFVDPWQPAEKRVYVERAEFDAAWSAKVAALKEAHVDFAVLN